MLLEQITIAPFRSVSTQQTFAVDEEVTALVGMNEAGKTVVLRALEKCNDVFKRAKFQPVEDYPRKDLSAYLKQHDTKAARAVSLRFAPSVGQIRQVNTQLGTALDEDSFSFVIHYHYDNKHTIELSADEKPVLHGLAAAAGLSAGAKQAFERGSTLRDVYKSLEAMDLNEAEKGVLEALKSRIDAAAGSWSSVVSWEVWAKLALKVPSFMYFDDYHLLPGKANLNEIEAKAAEPNTPRLLPSDRAVLSLLRMADVSVADFKQADGYETLKAKLEAISITLTDEVMKHWKQNPHLEVEVDIRADPTDSAPYNDGPNLYLRIRNRRHRGISTPFDQRSRGFIWFFSFLAWFDSVKEQVGKPTSTPLVLLLDEPALSLHALAQEDFLGYIDELCTQHQVLYTTHSPFMVRSERLHQVRVIEDKDGVGTTVSDKLESGNEKTLFPLQAALGWTIAQNLFISKRNLLVEGVSELALLQMMSGALEVQGKSGLAEGITIVPTGGIDKIATFVSLVSANKLALVVLHDYAGSPDQRLQALAQEKIIPEKRILPASKFRDAKPIPTDIEDLFEVDEYLAAFNAAFGSKLAAPLSAGDLLPGDRIVVRITGTLASKSIQLRPSGGFNHYAVAAHMAAKPGTFGASTMARFAALFAEVNKLLPDDE